jgi:hypothetical protein
VVRARGNDEPGFDFAPLPRALRWKSAFLGSTLVVVAVFLTVIGVTSHELDSRTTARVCTVTAVTESHLRGGTSVWDVGTTCGGALAIDPEAAHQTDDVASALAASLHPGSTYRLRIRGVLHNAFDITAYLEAATPA